MHYIKKISILFISLIISLFGLCNNTIKMYKEAENICSILLNYDIEQGPGMVDYINNKK